MAEPDDIFLPRWLTSGWLGPALSDALLEHAIAHEAEFEEARVTADDGRVGVEPLVRQARKLAVPDGFRQPIEARIAEALPALQARLGRLRGAVKAINVELAAHGDGAHFLPHLDTATGPGTQGRLTRRLSLICYLHRRPKAFGGGQLRFYSLAGEAWQDIEPNHDLMVAFPSWSRHGVQPVQVPSGAFADSRFAINIWIYD